MKRLADAVQQYLAVRRALGFQLRHETWFLPDFVAYLEAHKRAVITTELALRWARQPANASPGWWAHRLSLPPPSVSSRGTIARPIHARRFHRRTRSRTASAARPLTSIAAMRSPR